MSRFVNTAISLLLLGCGKSEPKPEEKPRPPPMIVDAAIDAVVIDAVPIDALRPIVVDQAGPAYVLAHGVFEIDEAGNVAALDARDGTLGQLAVDRRGRVWMINSPSLDARTDELVVYDGRRRVMKKPIPVATKAMAPAEDGGMWFVDDRHLTRMTESSVVRYALPKATDGEAIDWEVSGAKLLDTGEVVWVGASPGLYRFTIATKAWELVRPGYHADALVRDANGVLWTSERDPLRITGYDGATWIDVPVPKGTRVESIAAAPDGTMLGLVMPLEPSQRMKARIGVFGTTGWIIDALGDMRGMDELFAVDDAGRLWLRYRRGLLVLGADGHVVADIPNATTALLGNLMLDVVVLRDGPATLPAPKPHATGSVRGRVVGKNGKPARIELEVCADDCFANPPHPRIKIATDETGRFAIDNVVVTEYSSTRTTGSNATTGLQHTLKRKGRGIACCLQLQAGKTLDLGTLVYHPYDH